LNSYCYHSRQVVSIATHLWLLIKNYSESVGVPRAIMHPERFWFYIHSKILIQTLNFIVTKIDMQLICNTNLARNSNKCRFKVWLGRHADNAPWFQMNSQPLINVDRTWTYDVTLTLDNRRFIEIEVFMTTLFRRRKNYVVSICMHSQPWINVDTKSDDDVVSTFNDWSWIDVCLDVV
jgi:hypothetical protein